MIFGLRLQTLRRVIQLEGRTVLLLRVRISFMVLPGPALGIGRECDGLGPMPVGALIFFTRGGVYSKIWILGGVCSKIHQQTSPKS